MMKHSATALTFGPFRLMPDKRELWKGEVLLKVRALPLTVLTFLAQHPEQVISVEEIRKAVWGDTRVSRGAIRVCVREIRQLLGDEATTPCYIETVGRQGYRFIGRAEDFRLKTRLPSPQVSSFQSPVPNFVGREWELEQLRQWFAQAQQGQRQVVLVSGEPGIGKTTLVETFLHRLRPQHQALDTGVWVGRGQCVESYGPGEAYLPLLEAFGRLGRELGTTKLAAVLQQYAPTWLVQLPALVDSAARGELHRQVAGATQERMLRELCDALEVLTAEQPMLLVLEDLQWSDTATLAWLATVARRPDPAWLFVLGTYRPIDITTQPHPLRGLVQELRAHRLCREARLELLSVDEVREYVRQRFDSSTAADDLGLRLHQRTDGNPLFLTASVEALLQQGAVKKVDQHWVVHGDLAALDELVPEDLQHLITKQLEALAVEDQQLLEVASVSGVHFSPVEAAAGCQQQLETVETRCEQLVRRGLFIAETGVTEWPDGTVTMSYEFRHALYQQVVYTRLGGGQKVRLHRLIGERREAGYQEQVGEIAGELAGHFEQGRDYQRAARYRQMAAAQALRRSGQHETMMHCLKGLESLAYLPVTADHARQELALRLPLAAAQLAVPGVAADELGRNLERARIVCQEVGETVDLLPVVIGLGRFHLLRAERTATEEIAEQERRLLERVDEPALALQLHVPLGSIELCRGALGRAQAHFDQALTLFDAEQHKWLFLSFTGDPLTLALVHSSWSTCLSGRPDQARSYIEKGLTRAEEISHPLTLVHALIHAAMAKLFLREPAEAERLAQRSVTLAREHGFSLYTAQGVVVQNCAVLQGGKLEAGLATMAESLSAYRATGARLHLPFFLAFLAQGYLRAGSIANGLQVVTEALQLTATNLDVFWEAELYRLKGELLLAQEGKNQRVKGKNQKSKITDPRPPTPNPHREAEACFLKAIEIARWQGAKLLELWAVTSLVHLRQQQMIPHVSRITSHVTRTRLDEARDMLSEVYNEITEGFDTKDLQEAQALLDELVSGAMSSTEGNGGL